MNCTAAAFAVCDESREKVLEPGLGGMSVRQRKGFLKVPPERQTAVVAQGRRETRRRTTGADRVAGAAAAGDAATA